MAANPEKKWGKWYHLHRLDDELPLGVAALDFPLAMGPVECPKT